MSWWCCWLAGSICATTACRTVSNSQLTAQQPHTRIKTGAATAVKLPVACVYANKEQQAGLYLRSISSQKYISENTTAYRLVPYWQLPAERPFVCTATQMKDKTCHTTRFGSGMLPKYWQSACSSTTESHSVPWMDGWMLMWMSGNSGSDHRRKAGPARWVRNGSNG